MKRPNDDASPALWFAYWIYTRHTIYTRRAQGLPAPWTRDPILANYRFCNVYRQLDKVTVWLNKEWFVDADDHYLPFWAAVARTINGIEPLQRLRYSMPTPYQTFERIDFVSSLNDIKRDGGQVRGNAYIVSTNGRKEPFPEYIAKSVLEPFYEAVDDGRANPWGFKYLRDYAEFLQGFMGLGSFIAGQIIADLKYHHPAFVRGGQVRDWWTFVVPGPGSKRGLNRLLGLPHEQAMSDKVFAANFSVAHGIADEVVTVNGWPAIHAQDVQNCLCEFDKFERARRGQGRPKQSYPG